MALPDRLLTPAEYLERERAAETKSEYWNGRVYAMSGATRDHNIITGNVFAALHAQLRGRPCRAFVNDMRVKVSETGLYTYPDVVAACDPRFEDRKTDTLLDPLVVVEVLSPSTAAYDRGDKFDHYDRVPTLREYVLVAQNRMRVEHRVRAAAGEPWVLNTLRDPDAALALRSIGCALRLAEIYEGVELPPESPLRAVYEQAEAPFYRSELAARPA